MYCAFCENPENKDRLITENEFALAFVGLQPIVPGHTLIIPKRCVKKITDLTDEEKQAIFAILESVRTALNRAFGAEGFNYAWNENLVAGQTVPHFHLHIIPRKEGDTGIYEYEPRKFLYRPGSRANSKNEELKDVAKLIKSYMD